MILWGSWRSKSRRNGVALIMVLWFLVLLSVIAGGVVQQARGTVNLTRNNLNATKVRLIAEAGIQRAILALTQEKIEPGWRTDGSVVEWNFAGGVVRVSVRDEAGKIDLNEAPVLLLKGLMRAGGADERQAIKLANAIADYRDSNNLRRLNGAEDEDYAAAGRSEGAKDALFDRIEELHQVLGMTDALYDRIGHAVTTHSQRPAINLRSASREVLMALPNATTENIDRFLARRSEFEFQPSLSDLGISSSSPAAAFVTFKGGGQVVELRSEARIETGSRFKLKAIVRLRRGARPTVTIEAWEQIR